MNLYSKKIIIPKEIVKGFTTDGKPLKCVLKIECSAGDNKVELNMNNLSYVSDGFYVIAFADSFKRITIIKLKPNDKLLTLNRDFFAGDSASCCLFFVDKISAKPIAFGAVGINFFELQDFINYAEKTNNFKLNEENIQKKTIKLETDCQIYNDETVATENYYELEGNNDERENFYKQNAISQNANKTKTEQTNRQNDTFDNETNSGFFGCEKFYDKIKENLNLILSTYPEDNTLSKVLPESKFVKINYDEKKYYIVGTISENGKVKYICYGIPGYYRQIPSELGKYCSFVPSSVFNLEASGFWIIFQDAETGLSVSPIK